MKKISLYLTKTQIKALKQLSDKTGIKAAEIIRRMIDKGLEANK